MKGSSSWNSVKPVSASSWKQGKASKLMQYALQYVLNIHFLWGNSYQACAHVTFSCSTRLDKSAKTAQLLWSLSFLLLLKKKKKVPQSGFLKVNTTTPVIVEMIPLFYPPVLIQCRPFCDDPDVIYPDNIAFISLNFYLCVSIYDKCMFLYTHTDEYTS